MGVLFESNLSVNKHFTDLNVLKTLLIVSSNEDLLYLNIILLSDLRTN